MGITIVKPEPGPQGEQGPPGPPGPQGPPGDGSYYHPQDFSAKVWTINHNLGFFPNITVFDSTGREVVGDVTHVDVNTATVEFTFPFAGRANAS